jgi:chorismate mutase
MTTTPGIHRSNEPDEVPAALRSARATIDNIDAALVHLLAERFRCTQQVGVMKAEMNLPPSDPDREDRQVARLRALAEEAGLDPVFAEKFLKFIVDEVIRHHEDIAEARANGANQP